MAEARDQALATASEEGEEAVDALGLMHGIPFSVQDPINVKGKFSTYGMKYLCDEMRDEDAVVVKQYLVHGGIPLVKGNVPFGCIGNHTNNDMFGVSMNPLRINRTCGGSAGGDAALVASKCVPLAIGFDFNGDIRYPAAFCGIYSMKPTEGRFSIHGLDPARKNRFQTFRNILPCIGPIAATVDDCLLAFKVQCSDKSNHLDPLQTPSVFDEKLFNSVYKKMEDAEEAVEGDMEQAEGGDGEEEEEVDLSKIKIGILQESPLAPLSDATKRAMKQTERALKELGYQVVPFFLTDEVWEQSRDLMNAVLANATMPGMINDIKENNEDVPPHVGQMIRLMEACPTRRAATDFVRKNLAG